MRRPTQPSSVAVRSRSRALACAVALAASAGALPAWAAGTWTMAPANPTTGGQAFGLWQLTDGTILSHGNALNHWVVLTPDKTGNYAKGTWKSVASSTHARGGAQQHILKDGRFFQAGGEYIDGPACTTALCPTAEIYDPVANTWTATPNAPYDIGDTGSAMLSDGRILDSTRAGNEIQIYDPSTNTWSTGGTSPLSSGDENAWASLQNGGVLAVGYAADGAAIYNPATGKWARTGAVPSGFNTGDTAGISQMFDGRVIVYGFGQTYIYTPGATAADPGTWALGPKMLNGDEAEDEYSDTLPNGDVWAGLVTVTYGPGVVLQDFNPTTNTVSSATPPPDQGNPYPIDYVNLPNNQVMVAAGNNDWIYTPDTQPEDAWRPVVTSVVYNSGTTYTLTGMQISGLINGADEGDDMTMAQNYPIVWLADASGNEYFCRTFNFSNMMPSKGSTPETCQFTTPANLPSGTYSLYISAVGVPSKSGFPFTTGESSSSDAGIASGDAAATDAASGGDGAGAAIDASADGASGSGSTASGSGSSTGTSGSNGATGSSGGAGSTGAGNTSGSSTRTGSNSTGGAGSGSDGAPTGDSPGCGCAVPGRSSLPDGAAAVLGLAGVAFVMSRRRTSSASRR